MTGIDNRSGFPAELLSLPDLDGQEAEVLVVSAAWVHSDSGEWRAPPEPRPVCLADEYFGEPSAQSSIRNEAQVAWRKPFVDVLVNGAAYAPDGVPTRSLTVALYAPSIEKKVRVVGDRYRTSLGPSEAAEFLTMPVIYERAYGGSDILSKPDRYAVWRQNPAGIGFRGARSHVSEITTEFPNLEPISGSLEGPPAGFGIIARGWSPRLELAGTFDKEWLDSQWPLLPLDFDERHYQAAPLDQQIASIGGGDRFRLVNMTPDSLWEFELPSTELPIWAIGGRVKQRLTSRVDTVLIEPDSRTVSLTFRLILSGQRGQDRIREVVIGPVTPGYLRAKEKRKTYLDLRTLGKTKEVTR